MKQVKLHKSLIKEKEQIQQKKRIGPTTLKLVKEVSPVPDGT